MYVVQVNIQNVQPQELEKGTISQKELFKINSKNCAIPFFWHYSS
jgi:hypothetical protein